MRNAKKSEANVKANVRTDFIIANGDKGPDSVHRAGRRSGEEFSLSSSRKISVLTSLTSIFN